MNHFITDMLYDSMELPKTTELAFTEKRLLCALSTTLSQAEYVRIEDELSQFLSMLEREVFCCGFLEGIRFLLRCQ